jgi:peptide/nickel transport system permease protein
MAAAGEASNVQALLRAAAAGTPRSVRLARTVRAQPLATASLVVLVLLVLMAVFAPALSPHDPLQIFPGQQLLSPSSTFPLGTDETGRDVLSRIIYGARISLEVGFISVGIGTTIGAIVGIVSGYFGGLLDLCVQRVVDAFQTIPALILILALVAVYGESLFLIFLAIGIAIAPGTSRVVRSAVLSVKENAYIEAARATGAPTPRILFVHILPNVSAPIIVLASVWLGNAILIEASLSFLGIGGSPSAPDWGAMLSRTGRQFLEQAPWLAIAPGVAISLTVLAFNLFGDGLRDVLDPRLRGRTARI